MRILLVFLSFHSICPSIGKMTNQFQCFSYSRHRYSFSRCLILRSWASMNIMVQYSKYQPFVLLRSHPLMPPTVPHNQENVIFPTFFYVCKHHHHREYLDFVFIPSFHKPRLEMETNSIYILHYVFHILCLFHRELEELGKRDAVYRRCDSFLLPFIRYAWS